jgi:uncharacterized cofD-like protein
MKKNIVCFGGGNAVPKAILLELKNYPVHITSVTSMVDNGGSTGQLRKEFNILPPGDIRRHLLALSDAPSWKKELWEFRFGNEVFYGGHRGHNFGNVFIGGLEYAVKDYSKVLGIVHKFLEIKDHQALPATVEQTQLVALLEGGKTIFGEDEIDIPRNRNSNLKIRRIYLKPKVKAYLPVLEALKRADLITIGPGDLYSSSLPCFLPEGISVAIKESKAKKVFVCNTMTKLGETNNFSVLDFSSEVEKYLDCSLDFVIYNQQVPSLRRMEKHKKENAFAVEMVRVDRGLDRDKFVGTKILEKRGPIIYNSKKLVKLLRSLI